VTILAIIDGAEKANKTQQINVQHMQHNLLLATGPNNCSSITKGFRDQ